MPVVHTHAINGLHEDERVAICDLPGDRNVLLRTELEQVLLRAVRRLQPDQKIIISWDGTLLSGEMHDVCEIEIKPRRGGYMLTHWIKPRAERSNSLTPCHYADYPWLMPADMAARFITDYLAQYFPDTNLPGRLAVAVELGDTEHFIYVGSLVASLCPPMWGRCRHCCRLGGSHGY